MLHFYFWFRHILRIIGTAAPLCGLWWAVMIFQKEAEASSLPPHHPNQRNAVSLRGQKHSFMHYYDWYQFLSWTTSWTSFDSSPSPLRCWIPAASNTFVVVNLRSTSIRNDTSGYVLFYSFDVEDFSSHLHKWMKMHFGSWFTFVMSGCRLWAPGCSHIILLKGVLSFSL